MQSSLVALAIVMALPAGAAGVCSLPEGVITPGVSATEPVDEGDGFVSWAVTGVGVDIQIYQTLYFLDCDTGEGLSINFDHLDQADFETNVDHLASVWRLRHESDEVFTIGDVAERYETLGFSSSFRDGRGRETCGCDYFYPELQGDKIGYEELY